ncbi:MAG: YraN family protein [Deltaproteobacteria bacterium]|nr:YraN family protein [Deltaproteobacteria bacterium]
MSLREIGLSGEHIAVSYLKKKGYKILATNFQLRFGEIDIVAQKGQTLCFVEVKTRNNTKFGNPEEAVSFQKQKRISLAATVYLSAYKPEFEDCRFDVLSLLMGHPIHIKHYESAFDSPLG